MAAVAEKSQNIVEDKLAPLLPPATPAKLDMFKQKVEVEVAEIQLMIEQGELTLEHLKLAKAKGAQVKAEYKVLGPKIDQQIKDAMEELILGPE